MEKRTGTVIISVEDREQAPQLNAVISKHSDIVLCRMGYPRKNSRSIIRALRCMDHASIIITAYLMKEVFFRENRYPVPQRTIAAAMY